MPSGDGPPPDIYVRLQKDAEYREQILAWLRANGIDPADVPGRARASVVDGMLTVPLYVRNEHGRLVIDPSDPLQPATHTVTVPVRVEPNADVLLWLTPRCETCGR
jgi:hypothetical protein